MSGTVFAFAKSWDGHASVWLYQIIGASGMAAPAVLNGAPGMVRGAARHRLVGVVADR